MSQVGVEALGIPPPWAEALAEARLGRMPVAAALAVEDCSKGGAGTTVSIAGFWRCDARAEKAVASAARLARAFCALERWQSLSGQVLWADSDGGTLMVSTRVRSGALWICSGFCGSPESKGRIRASDLFAATVGLFGSAPRSRMDFASPSLGSLSLGWAEQALSMLERDALSDHGETSGQSAEPGAAGRL